MLKRRPWLGAAGLLLGLATSCGAGAPRALDLPPPTESTTLGAGDKFKLRIVGDLKEVGEDYEVFPDGTANFPYVNTIKVEGLEPHEIAKLLREQLIAQQVFTNPVVTVTVSAYASKRIEVGGEVKKPGSFPMEPGMTLLRAIALAGGLTSLADEGDVTIRRRLKNGKVRKARLDYDDIIDNRIDDIPLQAGDSVNVAQSPL